MLSINLNGHTACLFIITTTISSVKLNPTSLSKELQKVAYLIYECNIWIFVANVLLAKI